MKFRTTAALLSLALSVPALANPTHCPPGQASEAPAPVVQNENPFRSFDQVRLAAALEHAEAPDPAQQIRQLVLANRNAASEQLDRLVAATFERETVSTQAHSQAHPHVIDRRHGYTTVKGIQYPIRVSLLSNGELVTRVQTLQVKPGTNAYVFEEVHNTEELPHAVTVRIEEITRKFVQSFPEHSPKLAAITLQTRKTLADNRNLISFQATTLAEAVTSNRDSLAEAR